MSAVENVADVLDAAADLLEKPGAWIKGDLALDASGEAVDPSDSNASCWCVMGATERVSDASWARRARNAFRAVIGGWNKSIPEWNDAPGRTQAEVVAKLREAAALARQEQAA